MQDEWYMYMPEVVEIHFERDTGVTDHIPYVTLKGCKEAVTMMVQTVSNNYEGYTKCDMERAILAYKVQSWVANPTDEVFKQMARFHVLKNNPITLADFANAQAIFGAHHPGVQAKTVRVKPERVDTGYLDIPRNYCP